jgi:hypothetical protein
MSEEGISGSGEGKQFELLLDVKYVLLILMIFAAIDAYFSFVFAAPLCKSNLKDASEVIAVGHIVVFICLFSAFYAVSIKFRMWFSRLTTPFVSPVVSSFRKNDANSEEILREYFVENEELLEYALQTDSANLYDEVKEHDAAHFRFVRVCELTFSIGILLMISLFSPNSTLTTCFAFLGIFRWLLILPILAMLLWAAHAPAYNEKKVYVGRRLAEKIRKKLSE